MIRRSSRNVTWSGTTLVLMPPLIRPTLRVGDVMPGVADRVLASDCRLRIERREDGVRRFQRVDAAVGNGGMRLLAFDHHLQMQAAVVGVDDRIGKARGDDVVRPASGPRRASRLGPISPPDSSS